MNPQNSVVEQKNQTTDVVSSPQIGVTTMDEEITPEEELQIAGYQPEQAALIDQEFLIQREGEQTEPQTESENPLIRFAIAALLIGGIMGFGWMIWAIFFTAKPIAKPVPTPTTPTAVATQGDEASRLKAELALRNQASQAEQPQQLPPPRQQPTPTAPSPTRQKTAPGVRQSSPPPRVIREPALPPRIIKEPAPPPRIIRERVSVTPPQRPLVVPTPTPQEQIDPFERWNQLATIGQQTIENNQGLSQDLTQSTELPQREAIASRAIPAADTYTTSSPAIPVVQIGRTTENEQLLRESSTSDSEAIPAVDYTYTTSTNEAVFEGQSDDGMSNIDNEQIQTRSDYEFQTKDEISDINNQQIQTRNDYEVQTNDGISDINNEKTRSEPEFQTKDEISNISNQQIQTRGERGILNRTPQNFASSVAVSPDSPMQIQIGTSAKAKVLVPTIWAEEDKGGSQGRFAVELQEDVLSTDNRVALPKGTILITEVESVTKANKLVKQSVVAVVYADSSGQIQQQTIPKDAILIRGEDSQPLIARGMEDRGSALAQQDILIGLLGAAGRAGEIFNQNQNQSSIIISSDGSSSQTISTNAREPNVLAATIEGFFKPTAERLGERADASTQELINRPDVAVVPAGTKVSIFFNTFFEVNR
jgi:hypothetical protein